MCKKTWCLLLAWVILTHSWPSRSELFRNKNISDFLQVWIIALQISRLFQEFRALYEPCHHPFAWSIQRRNNWTAFLTILINLHLYKKKLNTRHIQYIGLALHHGFNPKQKRRYFSFQLKIIIHNESANNTLATLCLKETCLFVLPHIVIIVALCNTCRTFWWNCRTL